MTDNLYVNVITVVKPHTQASYITRNSLHLEQLSRIRWSVQTSRNPVFFSHMQTQAVLASSRLIYQPDPSRKRSMSNETPTAVDPEDVATKTLITMLTVMKMNQQSTPAIHKSLQSQEESKCSAAPGLTHVLNECPPPAIQQLWPLPLPAVPGFPTQLALRYFGTRGQQRIG